MKEMKFIILPATRKTLQNFNIFQYHFYYSLTNTVEEEWFNWKVYPVGFFFKFQIFTKLFQNMFVLNIFFDVIKF